MFVETVNKSLEVLEIGHNSFSRPNDLQEIVLIGTVGHDVFPDFENQIFRFPKLFVVRHTCCHTDMHALP